MTAFAPPAEEQRHSELVPGRVRLPWGFGDASAISIASVVSTAVALAAWSLTGLAVAVPLSLVGGIAIAAAIEDLHSARIPNVLVLGGLTVLFASWGVVATIDNRSMTALLADVASGWLLSSAPAMFAIWLVAPRLVGGGDWKLLSVLGAAVGMLAPPAAAVIPLVGLSAGLVVAAIRRVRVVHLGPFLAAGYLAAIAVAVELPELVGRTNA